jgi:tetratricopeptide (TPR) repeat protein
MWFFKRWKAAFLYGRALMRFRQKRYEDAVRLFGIVCKLEPEDERKELTYSYIGRSYLALGQYDEALRMMSIAYELFRGRYRITKDKNDQREFTKYVEEYVKILNKVGQNEKAKEIQREVEEWKISREPLH